MTRPARAPWPTWLRAVVLALIVIALAAPMILWRAQIATLFLRRAQVVAAVKSAGAWGPVVLIALYVAQVLVAPIPGQAINYVAGYLYGFWPGLSYSWLGAVLGSAAAMELARLAGRPLIVRLVGPALLERLDRLAAGRGLSFFFLVFLIPGLPDDAACFVAGLTRLPLSALIAAAAIGRVPGIVSAVWAGATAHRFGWQGQLIIAALAAVVALIAWRYRDWLQEKLLGFTDRVS